MKIIFILVILLLPFKIFSIGNDLIIVEIKVRGESPDNSYIKIYNPSDSNIDITRFRIRKKSSTGKEYSVRVFPQESFIPAKGYFLWANSKDEYHLSQDADVYSATSISSNNSVALFSSDGEIIDAVAWGSGENQFVLGDAFSFNPETDEIIKRIRNDVYRNTGNNAEDFYLFSDKKQNPSVSGITEKTFLEKDTEFPLLQGLSLAFLSGLLILYIKKAIS